MPADHPRVGRRGIAVAVLLLWLTGLALLARRELGRKFGDRLTDAAARVAPGAVYYIVEQGENRIGFASSTIDTSAAGFTVNDYFVADVPLAGRLHRASGRSVVEVSRTLRLRTFSLSIASDAGALRVAGRSVNDTGLVFTVGTGQERPDTQRVHVDRPLLMPTLVPLAVALGQTPRVGRRYTLPIFDPTAMAPRDLTVRVTADSTFVTGDSAVFDAGTRTWVAVPTDTVRAWCLAADGPTQLVVWVDETGRIVSADQPGFRIRRAPFALAYNNWRAETDGRPRVIPADRDIMETTAIAAAAPLGERRVDTLRVRLENVSLRGFDLAGGRQSLAHDTLTVTREDSAALLPAYALGDPAVTARFRAELAPEPLVQSRHPGIVALAARLRGADRDPRVVAQRINQWVYDSVGQEITFGVPNAVEVLRTRNGDCNEHTQLYLALARAAGVPARGASGLAYIRRKFYYHAWPEVYLGRWVAIDPTFGEFPADAAHVRFVYGGLNRQAELLRLMGKLRVDVVSH